MKPSVAIAVVAALAFGTASLATTVSAAELSKDELILKLMRGKHARKVDAGSQGHVQMMVIDPGAVKKNGAPLHQQLVVAPPPVISKPGPKTKMMVVQPLVIQPGKTQIVAQPMIVAPGGGIKKPLKSKPQIAKMVVQPQQIIAEPTPDDFRKMSQRKIVVEERKELAAIVEQNDLPTVDMEVYFSYDSSAIEPEAFRSLIALGQALSDPRLEGGTFLIAGHTDGTGTVGYNQGLSERRAFAIKGFLVQNFHLDPQSLLAVGYGEEQLKDYADPASGVNRRVQVANLSG